MNAALDTLTRAGSGGLSEQRACELLATGGQLIDVRSPAAFRQGTLPGAMNLPLDALCYDYHHLDRHEPVILYGNRDVVCFRAAHLLAGKGFRRIYHLAAGRV